MVQRRWDEATGVVTPEAVPLQFREANAGSRAIAYIIDLLAMTMVLGFAASTVNLATLGGTVVPDWVAITLLVLVNFIVLFGYPTAMETLWHGQTLGKAAMGLRVVTVEGAPVRFRQAAIRAALGMVDFFMTVGLAGVLTTVLTRRHQRLGDLVAGTVVLRHRSAGRVPSSVQFPLPPWAVPYAQTIDPSSLTSRDYHAVREFLMRAGRIRTDVRSRLATRLAQGLAAKVHHAVPSWVSPELFLVCAATRYQVGHGGPLLPAPPPPPPPSAPPERWEPRDDNPRWGDFAPPQ